MKPVLHSDYPDLALDLDTNMSTLIELCQLLILRGVTSWDVLKPGYWSYLCQVFGIALDDADELCCTMYAMLKNAERG